MTRVLVAEDDPEMRRLVVEALRKDGHDVLEAADGGRLLVRLAEAFDRDPELNDLDVVVSDMRMPVCSGLDLFERLAEARWNVPFILMTAFGDDDTRRRAERIAARRVTRGGRAPHPSMNVTCPPERGRRIERLQTSPPGPAGPPPAFEGDVYSRPSFSSFR
jgi:CheY-like chemotaxis protein